MCASPACDCAAAVASAAGDSGSSAEYYCRLLAAMRARGVVDVYLEALLPRVQAARAARGLAPLPLPATVLTLDVLAGEYAVCRLAGDAAVPAALLAPPAELCSVTRTAAELSIVCAAAAAPAPGTGVRVEAGWRCLRVRGPLAFDVVGILAELSSTLAAARVPLFSLSTYDTDNVLVSGAHLHDACAALRARGHVVVAAAAVT